MGFLISSLFCVCDEHISIIFEDFTERANDFITRHMFQVLTSAADQIVPLSCKHRLQPLKKVRYTT